MKFLTKATETYPSVLLAQKSLVHYQQTALHGVSQQRSNFDWCRVTKIQSTDQLYFFERDWTHEAIEST